ncbi:MAG: hypothetical protein D6755_12330, partial [Anaerolineae bacterium]
MHHCLAHTGHFWGRSQHLGHAGHRIATQAATDDSLPVGHIWGYIESKTMPGNPADIHFDADGRDFGWFIPMVYPYAGHPLHAEAL